ncbi:MAG: DUF2344 domain-containing protein, partial [bacterium]
DPKVSFIEGLISRGDKFTAKIIYRAYLNGAKFDSERKYFNFNAWINALKSFGDEYDEDKRKTDIDGDKYNYNNLNKTSNEKLYNYAIKKNNYFNEKITYTYNELLNKYLYIQKDLEEILPWDFIDIMVDKEYLKSEFKKSFELNKLTIYNYKEIKENITENCRKICYICGVCDFKTIKPVYSSKLANSRVNKNINYNEVNDYIKNDSDDGIIEINNNINNINKIDNSIINYREKNKNNIEEINNDEKHKSDNKSIESNDSKILIKYSKKGDIKYLGHLETIKILLRALRMSNIKISYTKSKFSPKPKVSFSNPIPFMAESGSLYIIATVNDWNNNNENENENFNDSIKIKLNNKLPDGLQIVEIINVEPNFKIRDIILIPIN